MIIIAVTFLGLLGHTFAAAVTSATTSIPKECLELKGDIKSGLDVNQFFTGDWYLTHSRDSDDTSLCQKYQVSPDLHLSFKGNDGKEVKCQGAKDSGREGFYSFQCSTSDKTFTSFMAVVETDYTKYALLYRCGLYGQSSTPLDNFLLFNRQSSGEIPKELKAKLRRLDLNTSLTKLGCT
uniref:Putative triabin length n=1 Tax=Rhodnius prolixus TaxID=13249 RepID=R4G560_RHOPR